MRKLILAMLLSVVGTSNTYAAKGDVLEGNIQQVIELPNLSKENIYSGSRQWVATTFRDSQSVIQMDDKADGIIIGKGNFKYPCSGSWMCSAFQNDIVKFTVKIEAKDNKARITFSDIRRYSPPTYNAGFKTPELELPVSNTTNRLDTVSQVRDKFNMVIIDYKNTVGASSQQNDNW